MKELPSALRCPYRLVKAVITKGLITESSWAARDSAQRGQKYPSDLEVTEQVNITKVASPPSQRSDWHLQRGQVPSASPPEKVLQL